MKKKTHTRKAITPKDNPRPIDAAAILRSEASRLEILASAMPDAAQGLMKANVWAHTLSAAFLDSLGAPEKLIRYLPAP